VGAFVLFMIWVVGLGLTASVFGAILPDVPEGLGLAMQVLFYGAPIVYPLALVPEGWVRTLVTANPITPLVESVRTGLISSAPPPATSLVVVAIAGLILVVVGSAALDRWRYTIADLL
jgi:ABC-type polysaccharide/polyol phosphate export permease